MKGTGFVLSLSNQYSFDSSEQVTTSAIVLNGTTQYSSWGSSQLVFALWNSSSNVYPKVTVIQTVKPVYVLNAFNYTYQSSNNSLIIFGQQLNKTITIDDSVGLGGGVTNIHVTSATAIMASAPVWDPSLKQVTLISTATTQTAAITVVGANSGPLTISLNGAPSSAWSYNGATDTLTLTATGTWIIGYAKQGGGGGGGSSGGGGITTIVQSTTTSPASGTATNSTVITTPLATASPQVSVSLAPYLAALAIGIAGYLVYEDRKKH